MSSRSRDKFMATVAPLLAGLRAFTGYTINLIAGRMDGDRFDVVRCVGWPEVWKGFNRLLVRTRKAR